MYKQSVSVNKTSEKKAEKYKDERVVSHLRWKVQLPQI